MQITTTCPFCTRREDTHHALIGCNRAAQQLEKLQNILTRIVGTQSRSLSKLLPSVTIYQQTKKQKLYPFTLSPWQHQYYGRIEIVRR